MSRTKKITQNINKDAGLLDLPEVKVPTSKWITKHSNYISCNIGDIVPVYCSEVVPKEKRKVTSAMLSHMTTPQAPLFNAMYTELRAFFVPHRISADLLAGYKTRKSPWVKVFGEDNASTSAQIIVPLAQQALPDISSTFVNNLNSATLKPFGGIMDALDLELNTSSSQTKFDFWKKCNFLNLAAYELIYQSAYRNQNREAATNSDLYKFLYDGYNRTSSVTFNDSFHIAQREKDYFTGSSPFTQKASSPINVGLLGTAPVVAVANMHDMTNNMLLGYDASSPANGDIGTSGGITKTLSGTDFSLGSNIRASNLVANLASATGVNIEQLRLMIKTQELLEKDMMYGSDYASYLNAHFGVKILKGLLDEPQEIKKVTITSQMQAIFQTSTTANEPTALGTIGANATTQSGEIEIIPETFFPEYGYLIICAVHKAQNAYDAMYFKPKHLFKQKRFDYFVSEIEDLGYQSVTGLEMNFAVNSTNAVSFNESFAEYRFDFNKVHGMLEPSRSNALDYWVLALSNYNDIQSMYKQATTELDRAISVSSSLAPQFFDAYGFVEICEKPMKLHSIPGMDAVI